jgi:hypothetical protein
MGASDHNLLGLDISQPKQWVSNLNRIGECSSKRGLTCSIPQGKLNVLSIDFNICYIVLKHSRDVELLKKKGEERKG